MQNDTKCKENLKKRAKFNLPHGVFFQKKVFQRDITMACPREGRDKILQPWAQLYHTYAMSMKIFDLQRSENYAATTKPLKQSGKQSVVHHDTEMQTACNVCQRYRLDSLSQQKTYFFLLLHSRSLWTFHSSLCRMKTFLPRLSTLGHPLRQNSILAGVEGHDQKNRWEYESIPKCLIYK